VRKCKKEIETNKWRRKWETNEWRRWFKPVLGWFLIFYKKIFFIQVGAMFLFVRLVQPLFNHNNMLLTVLCIFHWLFL
jgi:hypothetical protein